MEQATPAAGEFTSVSAGYLHTCGVRTDGAVACWGSYTDEFSVAGEFASVSVGDFRTCGVRPIARWSAGAMTKLANPRPLPRISPTC